MVQQRFIAIWFCYLTTDWLSIRRPELRGLPFVLARAEHGRKIISALNPLAQDQGIGLQMPLANAKAIVPDLQVFEDQEERTAKLLTAIAEWCIRYTPLAAVDLQQDGLFLDISGCAHLWGGEAAYLSAIVAKLQSKGYQVRAAIADTMGAAWAVSRFGKSPEVIPSGEQAAALLQLPPAALRLDQPTLFRLHKLGLSQISSFITMPRSVLRRRFGEGLLLQLAQALGQEKEAFNAIEVTAPYQERLPCFEPIRTATGIEIAIKALLEGLCKRLREEGKGLRQAVLKCFRVDGKMVQVAIGTNSPSYHISHLCKLFELKISQIEPGLGIELFLMEAGKTEAVSPFQEALWESQSGLDDRELTELLDRLAAKVGAGRIHRYLPDAHYWPERSVRPAATIAEQPDMNWRTDRPRPTHLLKIPQSIAVTAPIPDYPPMLFRYQGELHHIRKADGPERIEREWWLDAGEHRDYYQVEDEQGKRYWIFRSGHYKGEKSSQWFIHGYFA